MTRLFGTDGIRGTFPDFPLDDSTIFNVGRALAETLGANRPAILLGRDTRESGTVIESRLAAGIAAGGGHPVPAGVIPTPAIAFLTRRLGYAAGVMISASHNPHPDNGVKIFSADAEIRAETSTERVIFTAGGKTMSITPIEGRYPDWRAIVPKAQPTTTAQIDRLSLLSAIKQAEIIARESNNVIRLTVGDNKVAVNATSDETGDMTTELAAETTGSLTVGLNCRFLRDAAEVLGSRHRLDHEGGEGFLLPVVDSVSILFDRA